MSIKWSDDFLAAMWVLGVMGCTCVAIWIIKVTVI